MMYEVIRMENKTCQTCTYFVQHYRKGKRGYFPVAWGHCTEPRTKPRATATPACAHYREVEKG